MVGFQARPFPQNSFLGVGQQIIWELLLTSDVRLRAQNGGSPNVALRLSKARLSGLACVRVCGVMEAIDEAMGEAKGY